MPTARINDWVKFFESLPLREHYAEISVHGKLVRPTSSANGTLFFDSDSDIINVPEGATLVRPPFHNFDFDGPVWVKYEGPVENMGWLNTVFRKGQAEGYAPSSRRPYHSGIHIQQKDSGAQDLVIGRTYVNAMESSPLARYVISSTGTTDKTSKPL